MNNHTKRMKAKTFLMEQAQDRLQDLMDTVLAGIYLKTLYSTKITIRDRGELIAPTDDERPWWTDDISLGILVYMQHQGYLLAEKTHERSWSLTLKGTKRAVRHQMVVSYIMAQGD